MFQLEDPFRATAPQPAQSPTVPSPAAPSDPVAAARSGPRAATPSDSPAAAPAEAVSQGLARWEAQGEAALDEDGLRRGLAAMERSRRRLDALSTRWLAELTSRGAIDPVAHTRRMGTPAREARQRGKLAGELPKRPEIGDALADGRLSLDNAHALVDQGAGLDPATTQGLIGAAGFMTAEDFAAQVRQRAHQAAGDDGAGEAATHHRRRRVRYHRNRDGAPELHITGGLAEVETIRNALDAKCDQLWRAQHPERHDHAVARDSRSAREFDALVALCADYLATRPGARTGTGTTRARPSVIVHIDYATLCDRLRAESTSTTSWGEPIAPDTVRRLACDAAVLPVVLGGASEPLDVGRTQRLVTDPIRAAVIARDRHCVYPGCDAPPSWCEAHHIQPWEHGGPTNTDNLCLLCPTHHHKSHEGRWRITGSPGNLTFHPPNRTHPPPGPGDQSPGHQGQPPGPHRNRKRASRPAGAPATDAGRRATTPEPS